MTGEVVARPEFNDAPLDWGGGGVMRHYSAPDLAW